jgi:hypothetical protein
MQTIKQKKIFEKLSNLIQDNWIKNEQEVNNEVSVQFDNIPSSAPLSYLISNAWVSRSLYPNFILIFGPFMAIILK